ncbi:hypothetical protein [Kitasatospora sp. MAP5-34]|uniref:hypothetical protein n=1 Tax=Kitasatospora sp. MAP5-34 TaxID=3035102 RepID=UPI002476ACB5|nr:hypothetical protein [Kitasatospora sp. MAP5-34]MDH6579782.1 hypothetical protein [Kitasatospora sp. MAP5-34]
MNSSPWDEHLPEPPVADLRDAIVTAVIARLAPAELPLAQSLHGLDPATALERLSSRPTRGEPLGFGLEEVGVLLTPAVWIVVDEAVRRVVDTAVERAGRSGLARRGFFRRRRTPVPVAVPALTPEQLASVEQCVLEAARQARLSPERGERIADGVVRRLVLLPQALEGPERSAEGEG